MWIYHQYPGEANMSRGMDGQNVHHGNVSSHHGNVNGHIGNVNSHHGNMNGHHGNVNSHHGNVSGHQGNVNGHHGIGNGPHGNGYSSSCAQGGSYRPASASDSPPSCVYAEHHSRKGKFPGFSPSRERSYSRSDSMESSSVNMESPIPSVSSMASSIPSPPDLKPDITNLSSPVGTTSGYSPSSSHGSGFFHMQQNNMGHGMGPQMSPSGPLQSPTLHSAMHSPGGMGSPSGSMTSPGGGMQLGSMSPTHPGAHSSLSTKHICAICGDRASGKHYGVYSCEGCKGFFKRTVRKDLTYACRDERNCIIDKRQRNRCQYCRYVKCLAMGMKREAVQEERQRVKEKGEGEVESSNSANNDMPVERILEAELAVDPKVDSYIDTQLDTVTNICQAADKQLFTLVEWAKRVPHFTDLPLDDQVILLRAGWNELLISSFSHRSISIKDGILLATGLHVHRSSAHQAGVGTIFDRVLTELVAKMREMKMDKTEVGCLRAIVLFNPDAKGLSVIQRVEVLREKVYASLEEYCKTQYPDEPGRFAKLLLRLPALRSIGLKCLEHLFFFKLIGDTPIDTFLMEMLESPSPSQ